MLSKIDRTKKKRHKEKMLHALAGVSAQLTQLETRTHRLQNSVENLKLSVRNNHGSTDGKLKQLAKYCRRGICYDTALFPALIISNFGNVDVHRLIPTSYGIPGYQAEDVHSQDPKLVQLADEAFSGGEDRHELKVVSHGRKVMDFCLENEQVKAIVEMPGLASLLQA
ncbi:unnamed protein product [Sphenostylis stenocarpa]|uniref:Uncharacterized protein n=1 Tax=Sphenostylis stenocarpa TaxID=92480 RepID=A0AA86S7Z5_9FABA|nr:unnamed protein product [Sphenostylis stenocarpa]